MSKFKVGDTVVLNSGGPLMTVKANIAHDAVLCEWANEVSHLNFEMREARFFEACLTAETHEGAE